MWTSGWIPTKFSWIYNWDITKNWLDFGDIHLFFKVIENSQGVGGWLGWVGVGGLAVYVAQKVELL